MHTQTTQAKHTMLSTAEAADYLGIKKSYLHKLMMRRVIAYYKPHGKLCFFDVEDLDNWKRSVRIASQDEINQQVQGYIVSHPMTR